MSVSPPKWYVPGSVISALWGHVMPKLAATVWKGDLKWPPDTSPEVLPIPNGGTDSKKEALLVYPILDEAREKFWRALVRIAFESEDKYNALRPKLLKNRPRSKPLFSSGQRSAHLVLDYFDPQPGRDRQSDLRLPLNVIRADAYDFVLSDIGMDVFIPPDPFQDGEMMKGRAEVIQMYKFRKTGNPPIGLPGVPATYQHDDHLVPIPQLSGPTGAYQIQEDWARARAASVNWWLSGSSYRGIMAELPRIIAHKWYEEVVWPDENYKKDPRTTRARFLMEGGLKGLLEERIETKLPAHIQIRVMPQEAAEPEEAHGLPGWNPRDIMITDRGLYVPDPGPAPEPKDLLDAIELGRAGNPVFTDTGSGDI